MTAATYFRWPRATTATFVLCCDLEAVFWIVRPRYNQDLGTRLRCGFAGSPRQAAEREPAYQVTSTPGYHRIGAENSWALVRAGRYTRRPFQADQLHVDLWWHGLNLARDAGTYLYNGEPPWNNGLAGTAVHNTVMVDRRDQMRRAGRFLWLDWAQASGRSFSTLSPLLSQDERGFSELF